MPLLISKLWKCQVARKGSVDICGFAEAKEIARYNI
jgi:hypothetical protein